MSEVTTHVDYVVYSPTLEKYMFVEIERGSFGAAYNMQWMDDFRKASVLDDEMIDKLLEVCCLASIYGQVVTISWYSHVANSFLSMLTKKEIVSLSELVLVPKTQYDVPQRGTGSPVIQYGVDFVLSEILFAGFKW